MKSFDILGIGCVSVDDLLYVSGSFPGADTKTRVLSWDRQCGGLTGTALVAAARLGARCAFAGLLGFDDLSRIVEENFVREGVDTSHAPRAKDAPVPHAVIVVASETRTRNIFYRIEGRIGADAAGLKATQPGGQRGIPTRLQVEEFLQTSSKF
jgi:sulfofructose kinase